MNADYERFVGQNRQLLIDAAQEKGIALEMDDLRDITGAQLPPRESGQNLGTSTSDQ